jgi:hypothetical protein
MGGMDIVPLSQTTRASQPKPKSVIFCDFNQDAIIIDFSKEIRKLNEEMEVELGLNQDLLRELESNPFEKVMKKHDGVGVNRMTEVLKHIEAMHNMETEYLDGYDMDDDFIDEDDEVF